jgi:hypothetical protein
MIIRLPRLFYESCEERFYFHHMSDLHIGAADCRRDLIDEELREAKERNARVLIAGDVFDAITPKDPRFSMDVLAPELRAAATSSGAVLNRAVDMAFDWLAPYAGIIHMIGSGNHETSVGKWASTDIIHLLIERLQAAAPEGHTIHHGGYTGAIVQRFSEPKCGGGKTFGKSRTWNIYYHHGAGGASPVTKGMIDFNRIASYTEGCDVLWIGHKHNKFVDRADTLRVPMQGEQLVRRKQWRIMSGAYTGDGTAQFDDAGNYRPDWAREKAFAPQGQGGVTVEVRVNTNERDKHHKFHSKAFMN